MKTLLRPALMSVFYLAILTPLQAQNITKNAVTNAQAARQTLSFDQDWRFRLGDIDYASPMMPLEGWTWKAATADEIANPANAVKNLNAAGWKTARSGEDLFGQKPGYAWLHATLPHQADNAMLNFASIDDNATVFVNGKQVATHQGWNSPFKTDVTSALNANGANEIYVLVENQGGGGGLGGTVTVTENTKKATGPALPNYNETGWRTLNVPHDWMIEGRAGADPSVMEGPFDPKSPATHEGGYLNGGIGWYRKTFTPAANLQGKRAYLQFDGVYMDSDVWINGQHLGGQPYGYTTFGFDISPYLKYGQPNTIAVRCNVTQPASRFYSGAGIYRNVWLTYTNPVHIIPNGGVYITTPQVTDASAQARVRSTVQNGGKTAANVTLTTTIVGPDGKVAATEKTTKSVAAGASGEFDQTMNVANPKRWDTATPNLYRATTEVRIGNTLADSLNTNFGIRTIEFTKDNGFLLNGKRLEIQGVCQHHDLGALGAAVNVRALERQLEILRSFGTNAIRTSHNPPAPELLDLCDRMGFVVMDEIFDEWRQAKKPYGYGRFFDEWSEHDLVTTVRRDRNHPSVIMWSHGNEIDEQTSPQGPAMSKRLADLIRREDPTRVVTSGLNRPQQSSTNGFGDALDLFGINYHHDFYQDARTHAKWPMIASETSSASSTRGEYGLKLENGKVVIQKQLNNQLTEYDLVAPGWGNTSEVNLKAIANTPWMAGQFVWTGFDYIGEPTPYTWPSRSSYFGIVDLAGFRKDRAWLYQSQWTKAPMVHIVPSHWNWEQFAGKDIPVHIYSNADSVELFLNDKSLGSKSFKDTKDLHLEFAVPYSPGTLRAVATKDGKVVARDEIKTAGAPAVIRLVPDRAVIKADGKDLSFVTVRVEDANGVLCPEADQLVKFSLSGPATIAGTDNGDPINHESFQAPQHKAFHGLALAIVQAQDKAGEVVLAASAPGLKSATTRIKIGTPQAGQ